MSNNDYELLKNKLNKDNINISNDDFNIVIKIYENLLKFILEYGEIIKDYPFDLPSKYYEMNDDKYYYIFKSLIKMNENNILQFLDYSFILFNCGNELKDYPVTSLYNYLKNVNYEYDLDPENFKEYFFTDNVCVIEIVNDLYIDDILESDYIDANYKTIIQLFSDIFYMYEELINDGYLENYNLGLYLNDYLNNTFYYLVSNDLIKNDYNHVIDFLNEIQNNIETTIDKMKLNGIIVDEDLFKLIDHSYKNVNTKRKLLK